MSLPLTPYLVFLLGIPLSCLHREVASAAGPEVVTKPSLEWSACFPELGCINTTEEWYHPVNRPHNPQPDKRHTIKTLFLLHRRGGRKEGDLMPADKAGVLAAEYNVSLGVTFLVHDFTSSGFTGWVQRLATALLRRGDRNIVAVDWEQGAQPPYPQAVANARVVGLEIVLLIRLLMASFHLSPCNVHIIGHGLGAHVAGYVGECVRGLGRITGLDPSGHYFQGMPEAVRLDTSDASFVDVIHTDVRDDSRPAAKEQGTSEVSGHVDFFPNGGRKQPECDEEPESAAVLKASREGVHPGTVLEGCSHKRAFKYFIESLEEAERGCPMLAFECATWQGFLDGKCSSCGRNGSKCSIMGFESSRYRPAAPGTYYLKTAGVPPFCLHMYRVEIMLAKPEAAKSSVDGSLVLSLVDKTSAPITMPLAAQRTMYHGLSHRMVAFHRPPRLAWPRKAELSWRYHSSIWRPGSLCVFCHDSLYVSKLVVVSMPLTPRDNGTTAELCSCDGSEYAQIKSNSSQVFVSCAKKPAPT